MRDAKVLVTGPTGNLGRPLVRALVEENEVWGVSRFSDPSAKAELEALGVRCLALDLADDGLGGLPDDFDGVFHAASLIPMVSERDMAATFALNTQATGRLLSHCRRARTFVFCSTAGVYRHQPRALVETDEYGSDVPAYAMSKIAAEQLVRFLSIQQGTPTIILRIGALYGPDGGSGGAFAPIARMVAGKEVWVNPAEPRGVSLLWEADAVRLAIVALESGHVPPPVVNFCGDQRVSVEEYCRFAGGLLGIEPVFRYTDGTYPANPLDTTRLHEVLGRCETDWRDGVEQVLRHLYPELLEAAGR